MSFILGARDPTGRFGPEGGFVMLGKTFKGLTDDMLRWQSVEPTSRRDLERHRAEHSEKNPQTRCC